MSRLLCIEARDLIRRAAELAGVSVDTLTSPQRTHKLAMHRWAVMGIMRNWGWSYPRIARALGRKDHTSAMNGVLQARRLRMESPAFADLLADLTAPAQSKTPCAAPSRWPYRDHRTLAEVDADGRIAA